MIKIEYIVVHRYEHTSHKVTSRRSLNKVHFLDSGHVSLGQRLHRVYRGGNYRINISKCN